METRHSDLVEEVTEKLTAVWPYLTPFQKAQLYLAILWIYLKSKARRYKFMAVLIATAAALAVFTIAQAVIQ